jgi:outer membrane receptor protein involved in Fe transport
MAAGDVSSWTLLGEYEAHEDQRHAVRLAVSYSTQGFTPAGDLTPQPGMPESRSVGAVAASDRWRVSPSVVLDYGIRFDHYDYLSEPSLVSPHAGLGVEVRPGTVVRASTSQRTIAPGADEFLPPSDSGPWLPPVRTFFPLVSDAPIRSERIRRHAVGLDQEFGSGRSSRLTMEWFAEDTNNQMAVLFGLDAGSEAAPYYIATVGNVAVTGWRVGLEGLIARNVTGRVDYTEGKAQWRGTRAATLLLAREPSVARRGRERVSDLRGRVNVTVPATSTHLAIGYQVTRLAPAAARLRSLADDGFDLELRQRLPYQPLTAGLLHLVFTLSTLLHQHDAESLYDEILTADAPARLTAGIQVGF